MAASRYRVRSQLVFTMMRIAIFTLAIGLPQSGASLGIVNARPQSATATLSGTVSDEKGAVISGVDITITSDGKALRRQVLTSNEGYFSVALLPPDRYTVTAQHQGFATVEIRGFVLNVNDQRSLRIELKVGQVSESVTVDGASLIKTESAAVSTLVDRQFVENLPLNGRSLNTLIELTPGVVLTKGNSREQGQFSVNGQRANANYFMVDGVGANVGISPSTFNLSQTAGGTVPAYGPLGGTNSLVSIDALQEFRIQTSTYAPEFGRTPGAQVSIVTRSGANQFHGTLFDYFRNDALDANDWFANSQSLKKPALRQNDFGGVLGGPILKNKTFFFFSYEGLRLRQPQVAITIVPTTSARQMAPAQIKPLLDAFPLPTGPDLGDGLAEASASYSNPTTLDANSLRVDHTLSGRFTLFGRYNYAPSETRARLADGQLNNLTVSRFNTETLTFGATQAINSRISNDLRANYTRSSASAFYTVDGFGGAVPPPDSLIFLPFAKRDTTVSVVGVGPIDYVVGGDSLVNFQRQINFVDNLLIAAGSHQLKFGADYRRLSPILDTNDYVINIGFDDVAAAIAASPSGVVIAARSSRYLLFTNFSAYAQDTWRATPRLALTYGLRWEVNPPPSETRGNDAYVVTGLNDLATMTLAPKGTPLWKTTYNNFAPRLGVAYQISRAKGGEAVLRGGFGIFYDLGTGPTGNAFLAANFPYQRIKFLANTFPIDPAQAEPPPISLDPPYGDLRVYPDFKLPRTYQWNVSVERALGSNQTITASYVAAVGRRLLRLEVLSGPALANPNFTRLLIYRNAATSDYHALQLQFQRRLSRGLQALASYTWSHSFDIASGETFRNPPVTKIDPNIDRGPSNFDVRHSFSAAVTYDIPGSNANRLTDALLSKWSVDAIFRTRTATPVDLIANAPALFGIFGVSSRPDLVAGVPLYIKDPTVAGGRLVNKAAFATPPAGRQGTLGRNSVRGFPLSQLDLALRRKFALTERFSLQWKADFFNLLNHPNFGDPVSFLGSPLFGRSLQTLGRDLSGGDGGFSPLYQIGGPRSIQLALKLGF
jgi:Carboxypeptidase regulatory-like domain/TonB dependent receptor-like, beta-barrel